MALIKDGVVYRNLQEQVQKNADDIQDILDAGETFQAAIDDLYENKQNKLTAGENITIIDDVISATGGGGGSTVSASTQAVPGALYAYSINIDGTDYNIPTEGGTSGSIVAGTGIAVDTSHAPDTMISIDEQVVATTSALQSEVERAEGAEGALQELINTQESRLDGVEEDIRTLYSDKANQSDLNAEITRAGEAEATLNSAILTKSTVSVAGSGTSTTRVNYITVDGTEYELPQPQGGGATWGTITGNIANQQDLMQITSGLSSEISDEVNRAEAAEAALNQSILERATISYVDQADLELSEQISGEATTRRSDVQTLTNNLSAETTRASEAEATLNTAILAKADDTAVVHNTGNETVNGTKTFTSDITVQVSGNTHTAYYGPSVITHHIPEAGSPKVINLPENDGTFALTSDIITAVGTESERAQQAEATLNTAILARATTEYVDDEIMNEAGQRTMGDNGIINGYLNNNRIVVVSSMPASPSADTIYFVTGA